MQVWWVLIHVSILIFQICSGFNVILLRNFPRPGSSYHSNWLFFTSFPDVPKKNGMVNADHFTTQLIVISCDKDNCMSILIFLPSLGHKLYPDVPVIMVKDGEGWQKTAVQPGWYTSFGWSPSGTSKVLISGVLKSNIQTKTVSLETNSSRYGIEHELDKNSMDMDIFLLLAASSWLTICPSKLVLGFSSPMCIASRTVDTAKDEVKRKMNHIITKHRRELDEARRQIGLFLIANSFPKGDTNGKKGVFFVTFPLHESVKQNNAYITAKLLLFGADPTIKDTWGWSAYDYAKGKDTHQQILKARRQKMIHGFMPKIHDILYDEVEKNLQIPYSQIRKQVCHDHFIQSL